MGRRHNFLECDRADRHGRVRARDGVFGSLDVHMVRTGNMGIVIGILIIAVILWWPRKGEK